MRTGQDDVAHSLGNIYNNNIPGSGTSNIEDIIMIPSIPDAGTVCAYVS